MKVRKVEPTSGRRHKDGTIKVETGAARGGRDVFRAVCGGKCKYKTKWGFNKDGMIKTLSYHRTNGVCKRPGNSKRANTKKRPNRGN